MTRHALRTLLVPLALAALPLEAAAQCQTVKLFPSTPGFAQSFGHSVAIDGATLVVGTQGGGPSSVGYVTAFEEGPSGWVETQQLYDPNAGFQQQFGSSLDMQGDRVVVGARADGHSGLTLPGAAFVFDRVNGVWSLTQKLTASDASPLHYFGGSVAVGGDVVVVGATSELGSKEAVYVFELVGGTWVEAATLIAPEGTADREFGKSLDLRGSTLFIGSPRDSEANTVAGAVYVYEKDANGWSFQHKLMDSDAGTFDNFGARVAVANNSLWIASWNKDVGPGAHGAIVLFEEVAGVWVQRTEVVHPSPSTSGGFGISLDARGGRVVVGSWLDSLGGPDAGAVFVYDAVPGPPWVKLSGQFLPDDPELLPAVGSDVGLSGNTIVAGAQRDATFATQAGAAYVFDASVSSTVSYCSTSPNSVGPGAQIDSVGPASVLANAFSLSLSGAPPGVLGIFYYGPAAQSTPFGNGFGCVAGGSTGVFRLTPAFQTDGAGNALRHVDFTSAPAGSGPGAIQANSTWFFQGWYRDPNGGGSQFNLTDGLEATFCF